MPAGSLQKRLEHSPQRLRCPCRLKRANVRHSGRGGPRRRWAAAGPLHSVGKPAPPPPALTRRCLQAWKTDASGCVCKGTIPRGKGCLGQPSPRPGPPPVPGAPWAHQHPGPLPTSRPHPVTTAWPDAIESTAASPGGPGGALRPPGCQPRVRKPEPCVPRGPA